MFTRQFKVQMGKSTLIIISMKEKSRLWREINTSPPISLFMIRVSPPFDGKGTGPIRQKWTSKWLFPRQQNE